MKLHEYQAKQILAAHGLPVGRGQVADTAAAVLAAAVQIAQPVVVKAQVHVGGRGKAGGIRLVNTPEEAAQAAQGLLGHPLKGLTVKKVLVEEQITPEGELYVGLTVDRQQRQNVLLFSPEGGVDIEELAATRPAAIGKLPFHPASPLTEAAVEAWLRQWPLPAPAQLKKIIFQLERVYREMDAELVEVNPLAWTTRRGYVVLDAKITIDDNALFRQPHLATLQEESETDPLEQEAHRRKLAYVRLGGEIGIIGNGAGLVMGTMDEVSRAGGRPANFLDIGGGAQARVVKQALEVLLMDPNVRGIFLNIFGGITRCDEVARGLVEVLAATPLQIPLVIRLAGTRAEEGRGLLAQTRLDTVTSMQEGARKIVELTGGNA